MERINFNSLGFVEYLDKLSPQNSGILFSILLHFFLLLFALGLPNFFGQKDIYVPNIIPIEILNISNTTNIEKSDNKNDINKNTITKEKKFNSSSNTEVQKQFELTEKIDSVENNTETLIEIKEKKNLTVKEKKDIRIEQKDSTIIEKKQETIKTNDIKPKLKPKTNNQESSLNNNDLQIEPQTKTKPEVKKNNITTKPKSKPKEDFSIASMLKDLRNEKSNAERIEDSSEETKAQTGDNEKNENMILSITEIDLLRQQLSSCWNAPAGAVINIGDKVTISAKVQQNMKVFSNSVRIVDTNISKSNPFYGPITDSAMRTLLNPECTPLKLPKDKYNLWKNLTITFDYSIMKGY